MTQPGFVAMRSGLSARLIKLLVEMFRAFTSWTDADARDFTDQAVPVADAARRTMAELTGAWIAQQATAHTGVVVPPAPVSDDVLARLNVSSTQVYQRPFVTVRTQLARGKDVQRAVTVATNRLETIAEGDMQRAHTQAAASVIQALPAEAAPAGWRRTLHGGNHCPMCILASTHLYSVEDFNPSHARCKCSIELAYGGEPPPDEQRQALIADAVQALRGKVAQPGGISTGDHQALLTGMVRNHSELGLLLVRPGDHFTAAAELPS